MDSDEYFETKKSKKSSKSKKEKPSMKYTNDIVVKKNDRKPQRSIGVRTLSGYRKS